MARRRDRHQQYIEYWLGRDRWANAEYREGRKTAFFFLQLIEKSESPNRIRALQTLRDYPGNEYFRAGLHAAIHAWLRRFVMANILTAQPYIRSLREGQN